MILYKDIIKENDSRLREKSEPVKLPLSEEDAATLEAMNEYIEMGYNDELVKKYGIRPGVGLSAVQIGKLKKMFVILVDEGSGKRLHIGVINPKIISHSEEQAYLTFGEGCLSVDREVNGYVHRPKRISARAYLYDFKTKQVSEAVLKLENYLAIVFQHEYDHLNGILFIDRINKPNPYFVPENSSPVKFGPPKQEQAPKDSKPEA